MNEILLNIITAFVSLVVIPLIGFLGKYLVDLIGEKIKNETLKRCLPAAVEAVQNTVNMVKQTYADDLKEAGSFDDEAKKKALQMAIDNAKKMITDEAKKCIILHFKDFDLWLQTQIESAIKNAQFNQQN